MKLTFDEALERLNDGRCIHGSDVLASALVRQLWVAEWHLPGCLSESRSYCLTKDDALQAALDFAGDEAPRGMKTCLRRHGAYQHKAELYGTVVTTIEQLHLNEII